MVIFRFSLLIRITTIRSNGKQKNMLSGGRRPTPFSVWGSNDTIRALGMGHNPNGPPGSASDRWSYLPNPFYRSARFDVQGVFIHG